MIYVIGGLSSGSLFWKLFSILFVILHRIALHCTNNPCILKRANPLRCTRSTNHEVVERDLSLMTVEEIGRNTSDQPLRHQRGSVEIQPYAEINLLPFQSTIELQHNVAYARVGVQYYCLPGARKSKMTDKSGLQMHPEVLELQENVAYQRPSELRECSDIPVYEIIN